MNQDSNPFHHFDFENLFNRTIIPADPSENPDWVQNFIQDVLKNAMMQLENTAEEGFQTEISETQHYVIVKIRSPKTLDPKRLRVLARMSDIKLIGLAGNKEHIIQLPTLVHSTSGRAMITKRLMEIKFRKQNADDRYQEVFIRKN
ncbi:hypothetical protein GE107_10310 [Cohnella sp. CFH 77786]|uniref:hypothetical protein n=1 Tax=Cohnella sp. CFH 77786 TaxID=2662265 RepID=UPI001C60D939|nr:hypothetical protein [Cohnella sp. CFH 77786]MBW5446453.1 hypothetical protein [Cohnella sp. CFH 77786]